jgi:hypothetical protein
MASSLQTASLDRLPQILQKFSTVNSLRDDHNLHQTMGDKDLSRQDKLVIALVIALILSLGWGRWLPLAAKESTGRTSNGALTRASLSRKVPEYDVYVDGPGV